MSAFDPLRTATFFSRQAVDLCHCCNDSQLLKAPGATLRNHGRPTVQQTVVLGVLMHSAVLSMALPIASARPRAASAITAPIMAESAHIQRPRRRDRRAAC
jgi:hypothetical protein